MYLPYRFNLKMRLDDWSWKKYHIPFRLKYFYQRAVQGWSDADVWCMDSYLARTICGMAVELAETTHGYPNLVVEADGVEYDNTTHSGWKRTLLHIAAGMEAHESAIDEFDTDRLQDLVARRNHALQLLVNNFDSLWD